jgi:hypothetical protein
MHHEGYRIVEVLPEPGKELLFGNRFEDGILSYLDHTQFHITISRPGNYVPTAEERIEQMKVADEAFQGIQNTDDSASLNDRKPTPKPVCTDDKMEEIDTNSCSSVLIDLTFPTPNGIDECQVTQVVTPMRKRKLDICMKQEKKETKKKVAR